MAKRLSGAIPSVRRLRPSVPPLVEQTIGRALAPVPADRFGSAAEFAAALEAGAREPGTGTVPPPPGDALRAGRPAATTRRPALLLLIGGLLALGLLFVWRQGRVREPPAGATGPTRLAVLPFENLGAPEDEYFADGVSDAIRGKLTMVPGVQVIARTSSTQYRRTSKTPREVGRELGVEYLLTGTVRWEKRPGDSSRVQVNPELIQVSTAAARWQQPFDAVLSDVFRVQGDVAARVADALGLAMGAGQRETLEEKPTADLAAYDAFLKGEEVSQSIGIFDPLPLSRAVGFYEQAVALDPRFLQAWAQLSRAHSQIYYGSIPSPERAEQARVAAERAMA
ncbi:MAG: hypothetical protein ACREMG_03365, partial [Gemmatimonadales bacterium]